MTDHLRRFFPMRIIESFEVMVELNVSKGSLGLRSEVAWRYVGSAL